jgi:hypothetical protein
MATKLFARQSAVLPLAMSCIVIAAMVWHLMRFGLMHQTDEGTGAHIFQILMPLQLPVIGYFAIRWLPGDPRWAAKVLAVQVTLFAAIVAVVFFVFDR